MPYNAPVREILFSLEELSGFRRYRDITENEAAASDMVQAILGEAGQIAQNILAPLQRAGDITPATLENGVVRTSPGFAEGYRALAEGGWVGMTSDPELGGMGLPMTVAMGVQEMFSGACLSLQLNPMLTQGQIKALEAHASDQIKAAYIPKLARGEWAGTMDLTEPQAGSDVGAVRTRAEDAGDGSYRISGQKIYISWGDSDLTANVIHLVLARLPNAPAGTKGISLFLVPKLLPGEDGTPGAPNGLRVVSLEHKLGLHGSPTAVMEFDGANGWLIGPEGGGMAAMFTMMNDARLSVAMQGIGVAEAACQKATEFALERAQGKTAPNGTIIDHPDVRRMVVWMRARTNAARAIALYCAAALDMSEATKDPDWGARAAFLIPIAKSFATQTGIDVAQEGIQVHGGMGFIEETGASQYLRDVRVTAIYEGTNGIQAADLVSRKLRDGGEAANAILDEIEDGAETARERLPELASAVWEAAESLREATEKMARSEDIAARLSGSTPFLTAFALTLGAHFHLKSAMAEDTPGQRTALARAFIQRQLPMAAANLVEAGLGSADLYDVPLQALAAE